MGLLTKGWVWILTNDVSPVLQEIISSKEELDMYDGLMFISGLWDCRYRANTLSYSWLTTALYQSEWRTQL